MTRLSRTFIFVLCALITMPLAAQLPQSSQPPVPAAAPLPADLGNALSQIEHASQSAASDLKSMRIDKWKADSQTKQQSQQNADSVARNMTSALPGMVQQVRTQPQSVGAQFKLYRNLNALFDVLSSLTESAGAFGSKQDFQALSGSLQTLDQARLAMANRLESATAQQDLEISRLRTAQQQSAQAAASAPPKKIVVDDNEPASSKKSAKKATTTKKKSTPATTGSTASPAPPQ